MRLAIPTLLLALAVACTDSADVGNIDTDTGDGPVSGSASGTVTVSAVDAGADTPIDLVSGIAFANLDDGGRLYIGLTSWDAPGCDPTAWTGEGDDAGFPWAFAMLPPANEAGDDLIVTWSTGASDGSGTIFDFTIDLSAADASGLVEGDAVSGSASPIAGDLDDLGATTLDFEVPFCGDQSEL